MVQRLLGSTLKSVAVEEGIAGATPGSPPTYLAMGYLYFESVDSFVQAWGATGPRNCRRRPQLHQLRANHPNQRGKNLTEYWEELFRLAGMTNRDLPVVTLLP